MFTTTEMQLIGECLIKEVNENFKRFRTHSIADMNSLQIIKKINLLSSLKN